MINAIKWCAMKKKKDVNMIENDMDGIILN